MLRFEATIAYRHLRSGGGQTLLTVSAVAVGVIAIVFITALIFGARELTSTLLTDLLPHVTITLLEPEPAPLKAVGSRGVPAKRVVAVGSDRQRQSGHEEPLILSRIERQSAQRKEIENWPQA